MKLGVIADVHGNDVALRAVLADAARYHLDRWHLNPGSTGMPRPARPAGCS
jgi:predicted phosphodiesterase